MNGLSKRGAVITGTEASEDYFTLFTRVCLIITVSYIDYFHVPLIGSIKQYVWLCK